MHLIIFAFVFMASLYFVIKRAIKDAFREMKSEMR